MAEAAKLEGGPEAPDITTLEASDKKTTAPAAPLFKGISKTIEKAEDLAAYALELERKQIEAEAKLSALQAAKPADATPAEPAKRKSYADKLFADPDGTIQEIRKDLVAELDEKSAKEKAQVKFWNDFYNDHPDLVGFEDTVRMELEKNREAWRPLSLEAGRSKLAVAARDYLNKAKNFGAKTTVLPDAPASTAGVSQAAGATKSAVVEDSAPKGLKEQLAELQAKKRAKAS